MGSDSIDIAGGTRLTRSYRYDASGNRTRACSGSTCSVYTYGTNGAGPHAVSAVNGNASAYAYNANGEMTKDNGRSLTWSAFGKALTITRGNTTVTIGYGPGNRRTRKTVTGPLNETVTYLGSAERLDINGRVSIRRTLGIAGIAIIDTGGAQSKRLYPITDHLGSTIAIADSSGSLIQGLAYADFGKRYSAGWGAALTTARALSVNTTLSDRGYTGQESLDAIGLDDYNARLYDPSLGRFLSVDPLIGHPGSTQSINPYSYVENNPLNSTDPTGEMSCTPSGAGKTVTCTNTPLGSRIPQKTTVKVGSNGKVTTSGAGALPGGGIAMSTDGTSSLTISSAGGQGQGAKAANVGKNNPSDHTKLGPSKKEIGFLKGWEKYRDHPYDSNNDGKPDTIGWGHTMSKVDVAAYENMKTLINSIPSMQGLGTVIANAVFSISKSQGQKFFNQDVGNARERLIKVFGVGTLRGLRQNQRDALLDLEYNAGIKKSWNLVKDINARKYNAAAKEFLNIDKSNGAEMPGLYNRRKAEVNMFLDGIYNSRH